MGSKTGRFRGIWGKNRRAPVRNARQNASGLRNYNLDLFSLSRTPAISWQSGSHCA